MGKRNNLKGRKLTDVQKVGLSGPVKQVKQICYKARKKSINIIKGKVDHSHDYRVENNYSVNFNELGCKTEEHIFSPWSRSHKVYNERGQLTGDIHYFLNSDVMNETGKVMSKVVRTYDENGNELEQIHYDSNGSVTSRIVSEWDDNPRLKHEPNRSPDFTSVEGKGNLVKHTGYNGKGEMLSPTVYYRYDARGLMIENGGLDAEGIKINYAVRQFDEKGNEIEACAYQNGKLVSTVKHQYKYDKKGIKREEIRSTYDVNGKLTHKSEFTCNERGDVIEGHHYDAEGNSNGDYEFTPEYDEEGNIINQPWEDEEEKLKSETEECENDAHGNWIKKTTWYASSGVAWKKNPVNVFFREITYWGEEPAVESSLDSFFADIKTGYDEKYGNEEKINKNPMEKLSAKQLQWMSEASHVNDPFPIFRFYALTNKEIPSLLAYTGPNIEALALLDELQENLDAQVIYSYNSIWNQQDEKPIRYILSFPDHPGFLLNAMQIQAADAEEFEVPAFMRKKYDDSGTVYFSQLQLLRPSSASGKLEEFEEEHDFARELESYIDKCTLKKKPDKPVIYIVEANSSGFIVREHPVDNDFKIDDLDVNYGYGFNQFHLDLLKRFNTTTKGLVLFHGQPGTGKTYYIRHLLRNMVQNKKVVIYMPPNMVDHLVEPGFMAFLSSEVQSFSDEDKTCVLLIEDAEPLLAKRQEGVRIQGITNLLNMSDGLLNDMLKLQIICTFNVDVRKLDSALLRPGRLIARKEFKALPELDANLLAQRLGIKHHFKGPATLGEIYAMRKYSDTLIHDVESDKGASTLLDDLL